MIQPNNISYLKKLSIAFTYKRDEISSTSKVSIRKEHRVSNKVIAIFSFNFCENFKIQMANDGSYFYIKNIFAFSLIKKKTIVYKNIDILRAGTN